jgi:hypothetical protein
MIASMPRTIVVTLGNLVHWEQIFTVLSMERCYPFFEAMSLPMAIAADPEPITQQARRYLEWTAVQTDLRSAPTEDYVDAVQRWIAEIFGHVESDYDEATSDALSAWCVQQVSQDNVDAAWVVWGHLFRRLCGLVGQDELTVQAHLSSATLARVCSVVQQYLRPDYMKEVREHLSAAREGQRTLWEEWLESQVRYSAGEGATISAVDGALDFVELTIANHRVAEIWRTISQQISPSEHEQLVLWARRQAHALGMPEPPKDVPD